MSRQPTQRALGKGHTVAVVGDVYRFLATGEDTDGKYALWEAIVPPGGGPPAHVHSREEEGFFVLEGEGTFTVNGERVVADAGDVRQHAGRDAARVQERREPTGQDADLRGARRAWRGCSSSSACRSPRERRPPHRRQGGDREAAGGCAEVRHRDQGAGRLRGCRRSEGTTR